MIRVWYPSPLSHFSFRSYSGNIRSNFDRNGSGVFGPHPWSRDVSIHLIQFWYIETTSWESRVVLSWNFLLPISKICSCVRRCIFIEHFRLCCCRLQWQLLNRLFTDNVWLSIISIYGNYTDQQETGGGIGWAGATVSKFPWNIRRTLRASRGLPEDRRVLKLIYLFQELH